MAENQFVQLFGQEMYEAYQGFYPINDETRVEAVPHPGAERGRAYVVEERISDDVNPFVPNILVQEKLAQFEVWSVEKPIAYLLAFAPELNTVFWVKDY